MNLTYDYTSGRSPVMGLGGMVAATQPLAVAAGLEMLGRGGTAADAAVAAAAVLNVTEPASTGIGGDCFALYYEADTRAVSALNGSGRSPSSLTLERVLTDGFGSGLPAQHAYTVTVPGACAGWCDLIDRHGSLDVGSVLAPAIGLAEGGFPVEPVAASQWENSLEDLIRGPNGLELTVRGRAPRMGEIFRNPGLARALSKVAAGGKRAFYEGEIAEAVASVVQEAGGCLTAEDMAAHESSWVTPISCTYRGYRVWECPPNGQGLTALIALNILEGFDIGHLAYDAPSRLHLEIEALRLAFADAAWYVADPERFAVPLGGLLSKAYAEQRRAIIRPDRAAASCARGVPAGSSDTIYLSVVDEHGNACSFINSTYKAFGSGIVPRGWGFTLQNRGLGFSLKQGHPNAVGPCKRPYHTIIPSLITHAGDDELYACYGVMGGFMQPQGHVQVALSLLDDGIDPQSALNRPRFCISDGPLGGDIALDDRFPPSVLPELAALGHPVVWASSSTRVPMPFGRGQVILRDRDSGVLWGGSDPRGDGCAMAQL